MQARLRGAVLLMTMIVTASGAVHAQIFTCKDSAGRTLTSDREIPECASRDMREIGKNGVVKRVIPAPLTAEQRRAKQAEDERQKQQADAVIEARRRDLALLARFRNEGEIELAHKRATFDLQEKMRFCDQTIASVSTQLSTAEAEAKTAAQKKNNRVPSLLQQRIDDAKTSIALENSRLRQYQIELLQMDQSFDDTLKRYRELTGVSAGK